MQNRPSDLSAAAVIVIGGGPAGLMAAEVLSAAGVEVHVYDAMPSLGRKFLMAGRGGLNLTHSEPFEAFRSRYRMPPERVRQWLSEFDATKLRDWVHGLGIATFVGSSGRVFPTEMKASPLLRAWLKRLTDAGVKFHTRRRWLGWDADGSLKFAAGDGIETQRAAATILALGGASWARLGSDAGWIPALAARGVAIQPFVPANCGFEVAWSEHLRSRFAGEPVKAVSASLTAVDGKRIERQGEFIVSRHGVEGGLIYALAAPLRDCIAVQGEAVLYLDLAPGRDLARLTADLSKPRGHDSLASHLRRHAGITGVKAALLHEYADTASRAAPARLAALIKALPLQLHATRPLDEAISSAGGVDFAAVDDDLMLRALPGVFCAGEMLDWEAPTGGYLLTACFASGRIAAQGVLHYLASTAVPSSGIGIYTSEPPGPPERGRAKSAMRLSSWIE